MTWLSYNMADMQGMVEEAGLPFPIVPSAKVVFFFFFCNGGKLNLAPQICKANALFTELYSKLLVLFLICNPSQKRVKPFIHYGGHKYSIP